MPVPRRWSFIGGFYAGTQHGVLTTLQYVVDRNLLCPTEKDATRKLFDNLHEMTEQRFSPTVIEPVVTELYGDPANALVSWWDAILIAADRLSGKDVDAALRRARKLAAAIDESIKQKKTP